MSEATQEQWTIKRLLDWTSEYFQKSEGNTSPRLDAEILLAEALGCPRIMLYTRFDEVPEEEKLARFRAWVKRRGAGEPVAYIVGYREFYSLRFEVNSSVLIPRPETEHVVVAVLEAVKSVGGNPIRIIDVGTGSGCIAITLAKQIGDAQIAATDISEEAIAVANSNAIEHRVDDRIRFFQGDLLQALPAGSQPVHIICSNPPYIGTSEVGTMDGQVKDHEPNLALFSGDTGLDATTRLIDSAPEFLLPGGYLIFESSPFIIQQAKELVIQNAAFDSVEIEKDFAGHERIVMARKQDT
ncbi:MAG: peptide chain release factor N(5)-glutamine methyltransferase [Planctomycetota bacterium]